mmetsp:Transcript_24787/g.36771  ORF Transcript_24787/g.36771 Transcript_24787/m.36771 type:complete len:81 (-) Transcript_24787:485-727(-)
MSQMLTLLLVKFLGIHFAKSRVSEHGVNRLDHTRQLCNGKLLHLCPKCSLFHVHAQAGKVFRKDYLCGDRINVPPGFQKR